MLSEIHPSFILILSALLYNTKAEEAITSLFGENSDDIPQIEYLIVFQGWP